MQYQLVKDSLYVRRTDDAGITSDIPNDPANRDWQAYQAWLAEGNTPEPAEYT